MVAKSVWCFLGIPLERAGARRQREKSAERPGGKCAIFAWGEWGEYGIVLCDAISSTSLPELRIRVKQQGPS
jgi:hypothetical protein